VTIGESIPDGSRMVGSWLGRPYPAYCSDAGQALLWDADDEEVRAVLAKTDFRKFAPKTPISVDDFLERLRLARLRGYSVVDEEAEAGLFSIAVPVRDFRSEVVAAIQVVGTTARLAPKREMCAAAALRWGRWLEDALDSPSAEPSVTTLDLTSSCHSRGSAG
jgi:DNA-binding IclR family transcriptional regulator